MLIIKSKIFNICLFFIFQTKGYREIEVVYRFLAANTSLLISSKVSLCVCLAEVVSSANSITVYCLLFTVYTTTLIQVSTEILAT